MLTGTELAWETLSQAEPEEVCSRALVSFEASIGAYALKLFHFTVLIAPR